MSYQQTIKRILTYVIIHHKWFYLLMVCQKFFSLTKYLNSGRTELAKWSKLKWYDTLEPKLRDTISLGSHTSLTKCCCSLLFWNRKEVLIRQIEVLAHLITASYFLCVNNSNYILKSTSPRVCNLPLPTATPHYFSWAGGHNCQWARNPLQLIPLTAGDQWVQVCRQSGWYLPLTPS